jgi:hypothetical protein
MNYQGERENCTSMVPAIFFLSIVLGVFAPIQAQAAYWFLGIGNESVTRDVDGLWGAMRGWDGWDATPAENYRLRFDLSGDDILEELAWLSSRPRSGDVALFFYAGHGHGIEPDVNGDESAPGSTATGSGDEVIWHRHKGGAASDDEIAAVLAGMAHGVTTVAIFNTCKAGGMVGGTTDLNILDDTAVLMASTEDQSAYVGTPYSIYTQALIDGIAGGLPADADGDGFIHAGEWFNYTYTAVTDPVSPNYHAFQNPTFYASFSAETNRPLFSLHAVPLPPALIHLLSGLGLMFVWRYGKT